MVQTVNILHPLEDDIFRYFFNNTACLNMHHCGKKIQRRYPKIKERNDFFHISLLSWVLMNTKYKAIQMHIECFGMVGNDKTEIIYSRILTEIIVNMSIIINNVSVCTRNMLRWMSDFCALAEIPEHFSIKVINAWQEMATVQKTLIKG